ncbi:ribonuclease D [Bremerella cremea]|uniref:Ribonuclease D n=1 Tax=Blastopirellula marina TaxID=124 RepID=A0A2S8FQP2_9BACT|nr:MULTISPECIES: HRDC domain-containing protein [Pirellulaceae]PQO34164.1 ribonuclease D [Blastopirellula marina]RCS46660.1 ribonuclease D [Bremerella cremea]
MEYTYVRHDRDLQDLCQQLASDQYIFFDTEFISEDVYLPDLCLIQVASRSGLSVIDPKGMLDLTPFWDLITSDNVTVVAHAAREEFLFCFRATGKWPTRLFDTQVAAGLIGMEFPVSLGNLITRLMGERLPKGETRTNWRGRPLSKQQIEYALNDVIFLDNIYQQLVAEIEKLGRTEWMVAEMNRFQQAWEDYSTRPGWRSVSGIGNLNRRSLAIVRELWNWRDHHARAQNVPPRRVLRDDLVVELAKRKSSKVSQIKALRGMNRRDLDPYIQDLADCVREALELPDDECPVNQRGNANSQYTVVGQFLTAALGSICREARIAPSLACTVQDVRDLVAYHLDGAGDLPPLAKGWRAEVIGQTIEDLLDGSLVVRIGDPRADEPLAFQRLNNSTE